MAADDFCYTKDFSFSANFCTFLGLWARSTAVAGLCLTLLRHFGTKAGAFRSYLLASVKSRDAENLVKHQFKLGLCVL